MELWWGHTCGKDMKVSQLDQALASAPAMPADSSSPMMAKIDQPERSDLSIGRAERPRGSAAEQRDELAPFHCAVAPVLRIKDSTALLHCGISIWLMSLVGQTRSFGEVGSMSGLPESGHGGKTPALRGRVHEWPSLAAQPASLAGAGQPPQARPVYAACARSSKARRARVKDERARLSVSLRWLPLLTLPEKAFCRQ
jgi:hypothetical protein